jgi:hypothetical protein
LRQTEVSFKLDTVADKMTLNRLHGNDEGEVLAGPGTKGPRDHFQYVGGSGGTGKSWLIKAIQTVIDIKGVKKEMVITATSGTVAAGIGGNTIHSAIGLTFKDRDG